MSQVTWNWPVVNAINCSKISFCIESCCDLFGPNERLWPGSHWGPGLRHKIITNWFKINLSRFCFFCIHRWLRWTAVLAACLARLFSKWVGAAKVIFNHVTWISQVKWHCPLPADSASLAQLTLLLGLFRPSQWLWCDDTRYRCRCRPFQRRWPLDLCLNDRRPSFTIIFRYIILFYRPKVIIGWSTRVTYPQIQFSI